MKTLLKNKYTILTTFLLITVIACQKPGIRDVGYPESVVYLAQAAQAKYYGGGFYTLPSNAYNKPVNYIVKDGKISIPIGVIRAGIDLSGDVVIALSTLTDTVSKLIAGGAAFTSPTEVLPADIFNLPSSLTLKNGETTSKVDMSIDLNKFVNSLKVAPEKQFAIAINIATQNKLENQDLSTLILIVKPQTVLTPVADFYVYTYDDNTKTGFCINNSLNGASYRWDFGDGSPVITETTPKPHKYTTAGTYTIKLTVTGFGDGLEPSVKTQSITIK